jgi:hypothetical protein
MLDCDARAVTEQDGILSLPNHAVQLIELLLGAEDELIQRFAMKFQLTKREDTGRPAIDWIDGVFVR